MKASWYPGFLLFAAGAFAQYYQRLGGCNDKLGCVFPPDQ